MRMRTCFSASARGGGERIPSCDHRFCGGVSTAGSTGRSVNSRWASFSMAQSAKRTMSAGPTPCGVTAAAALLPRPPPLAPPSPLPYAGSVTGTKRMLFTSPRKLWLRSSQKCSIMYTTSLCALRMSAGLSDNSMPPAPSPPPAAAPASRSASAWCSRRRAHSRKVSRSSSACRPTSESSASHSSLRNAGGGNTSPSSSSKMAPSSSLRGSKSSDALTSRGAASAAGVTGMNAVSLRRSTTDVFSFRRGQLPTVNLRRRPWSSSARRSKSGSRKRCSTPTSSRLSTPRSRYRSLSVSLGLSRKAPVVTVSGKSAALPPLSTTNSSEPSATRSPDTVS
mmetsp:Transcript_16699/g.51310  ORF Transcript_16699/g.51310 Transcript_16699/m.51310 type:complete len:337 (-) Transcript_16699:1547-2557(-)